MKQVQIGFYRQQPGGFKAFIPADFPPGEGFVFNPSLLKKNEQATHLVGKLDGITKLLPDVNFFLLMYLRKDAAASSQIEGTKATMLNAIEAEAGSRERIPADVDDILHYLQALRYGMKRVKNDQFPISLRFMRELHGELMQKARASHYSSPGEFRKSQNWIDGTRPDNARFVPPPVAEMHRALGQLEEFIHADDAIPTLIKTGLIHAQFEIIHPFLDGNGRTGRMLVTFYLWKTGYLELPVLYLSAYLKKNREIYLNRLEDYQKGHIEKWLDFFIEGVIEISSDAIHTVERITRLRERDWARVQSLGKRAAQTCAKVLPKLFEQPVIGIATMQKWTGYTVAGAQKVIDHFLHMKILQRKDAGKKYGQLYYYREYLDIFSD